MKKDSFVSGVLVGAAIPTAILSIIAGVYHHHLAVKSAEQNFINDYENASDKAVRKSVAAHQSRY